MFINKCFVWCHIRHLNPLKLNPEKKADRNMVNDLDFVDIKSLERSLMYFVMKRTITVTIIMFMYQINNLTNPWTYC